MTNEQAIELIGIRKTIIQDDTRQDSVTINQTFPMNIRFILVSDQNDDFSFLWEITQSAKDSLRISLHFQEDDSKIGLFRVDYNSGHKNPEMDNGMLPDRFRPYIGKLFVNESHVHYHVDGYRTLAWALPINDTEIEVKEIEENDKNNQMAAAINSFARLINLETQIIINPMLL